MIKITEIDTQVMHSNERYCDATELCYSTIEALKTIIDITDMQEDTKENAYFVTINAGSSSIKLAVFRQSTLQKLFEASVENIGQQHARLETPDSTSLTSAPTHKDALSLLVRYLETRIAKNAIIAVGHRIVHGGKDYFQATYAQDKVIRDLQDLSPFDPEHLPVELKLIDVCKEVLPGAQHILCFDTAFHHDLPVRSRLLPLPRALEQKGIRRYGFHGLSYSYILKELRRVEGQTAVNGRVIIAHLGSGVSLTALKDGRPIDTTMSMTPSSGVPMSSRSGDLDPGLMLYLTRVLDYTPEKIHHLVTFESGLLGISETTNDMERLLELERSDTRALEAIEIFCYNITKTIGGFAAALGGVDTLVFTGGMGERAYEIRARVCDTLAFLGIVIDRTRNHRSERLISADTSRVGVHVIHTDEAETIAHDMAKLLQKGAGENESR